LDITPKDKKTGKDSNPKRAEKTRNIKKKKNRDKRHGDFEIPQTKEPLLFRGQPHTKTHCGKKKKNPNELAAIPGKNK